jgi:hypothetical protein
MARLRRLICGSGSAAAEVTIMTHLVQKKTLLRAEAAMVLGLIGGGLVLCALGAVVFDIGRMLAIW